MKRLSILNDWIGKIEGIFVGLFLISMILLAFIQVVARDIFNAGIPWADTVVRLLVLWVGFVGAALATKLDQMLTIEILTKYVSERMRHATSVVVKSVAIVVCFFLLCASLKFLANERSTGEKFLHLFPSWWTMTIIPMTFILIPFHLAVCVVRDIGYFAKGKPE